MQVLRAYANAGANYGRGYGAPSPLATEEKGSRKTKAVGGDTVSLSSHAREALRQGRNFSGSHDYSDATYDQKGNVTRQFDNLRSDLHQLARHFMSMPGSAGMVGKLSAMQSQLAGIEATI